MSFDWLYHPLESLDSTMEAWFSSAPLIVTLAIALLLGLRHASDPDHLVAVTSLVVDRDGDTRAGMKLGLWWGFGHSLTLVVIGIPLILMKSSLPGWLESGAEKSVGIIILVLALFVLVKWARGKYRVGRHSHADGHHHHVHQEGHDDHRQRSTLTSFVIGVVHGLGGSGAIVLLLLAALPSRGEAIAALMIFAPASMLSMGLCTGLYSWVLTRPILAPFYRTVLIPIAAVFGMAFGGWYAGLV